VHIHPHTHASPPLFRLSVSFQETTGLLELITKAETWIADKEVAQAEKKPSEDPAFHSEVRLPRSSLSLTAPSL